MRCQGCPDFGSPWKRMEPLCTWDTGGGPAGHCKEHKKPAPPAPAHAARWGAEVLQGTTGTWVLHLQRRDRVVTMAETLSVCVQVRGPRSNQSSSGGLLEPGSTDAGIYSFLPKVFFIFGYKPGTILGTQQLSQAGLSPKRSLRYDLSEVVCWDMIPGSPSRRGGQCETGKGKKATQGVNK